MKHFLMLALVAVVLGMNAKICSAETPWRFDDHTRYMVMGDSLGSGYGAVPQTHGYAYQLYKTGVYDQTTQLLLCNASVIGVTSEDVLNYQVPQAYVFRPDVVTLTVGGNDLVKILEGAAVYDVLANFQMNLNEILYHLVIQLGADVYIANLYVVEDILNADMIIPIFNQIVEGVATGYGVPVADIYSRFLGKKGLLLIERNGASPLEIHPSNAGHTEIALAFAEVVKR